MNTITDCRLRIAEVKTKITARCLKFKSAFRNLRWSPTLRVVSYGVVGPHSAIHRGFTLLEVLISLAIVSITLVVLIHSQLLSIREGTRSGYYTTAIFLGNEILTNTLMQENLIIGSEDNNFEDYPLFSWAREVEDTENEGLKMVKFVISGPENTQIVLNTYWRKR